MNHRIIQLAAAKSQSRTIAQAKILFFVAAGMSFLLSIFLFFNGDEMKGIFVGIWVPSILSAGNLLLGRNDHV